MAEQSPDPILTLVTSIQGKAYQGDNEIWIKKMAEWDQRWLEWVEKQDGKDPVSTAWEASEDVGSMVTLLNWLEINPALKDKGDRWVQSDTYRLSESDGKSLVYRKDSGTDSDYESVIEYEVSEKGEIIGEGTRKTIEDFAKLLKEKTKGQITQEVLDKYLETLKKKS